jgi:hypothetical protein
MEESIAGHVGVNGVYEKLGEGNAKGSMMGSGAFKTYANIGEGKNQVILI